MNIKKISDSIDNMKIAKRKKEQELYGSEKRIKTDQAKSFEDQNK